MPDFFALSRTQIALFRGAIDVRGPNDCWEWTPKTNQTGYGYIRFGGKQYASHRLAWMIHNQRTIPRGQYVRHACDNRACCNPAHLSLGTQKQNIADCVSRWRKPRGSVHGMALVTEADVPIIRALYDRRRPGDRSDSIALIAKKFGISTDAVRQIGKRRTWLHVLEADGTVPIPTAKKLSTRYHRRGARPKPVDPDRQPTIPLPGYPDIVLSLKQVARFWDKIDRRGDDECWPWLAKSNTRGYGRLGLGYRPFSAHRVAWMLHNNRAIPDGEVLCHSCDNPVCCNPLHLFPASGAANSQEMARKGRTAHGERHPNTVLTERDVRMIRRLRVEGWELRKIGKRFGIGQTTVQQIVNRATWKHVNDEP